MAKVTLWRTVACALVVVLVCVSVLGVSGARRKRRRQADFDEDEFDGVAASTSVGDESAATPAPPAVPGAGQDNSGDADDADDADDDELDADFDEDDDWETDAQGASSLVDEEEAAAAAAAQAAANSNAAAKAAARKAMGRGGIASALDYTTYYMEYIAVTFIALFIVVFIQGRGANEAIAAAFEKQFADLFNAQFAEVVGNDPDRPLLSKTSMNSFKAFATGRRGCRGVMVELDLQKRQNLIDRLLGFLSSGSEDLVTLTIPKMKMEPFIVALVAKPCRKRVQAAVPNLAKYARVRKTPAKLPQSLELMTDCPEMVPKIFPERACKVLREAEKYLRVVHISDEAALAEGSLHLAPCELRFQFALPSAANMNDLAQLMSLAFTLVDVVSQATLSGDAKRVSQRQRKLREAMREKERRADRAAQQKQRLEEKLAKEQAEYDNMTPAQRAKWDAKREAKRARKMRRPRMKMKM